ncbi:MAG: M23 family metallopeptidase [bacterium]
MNRFFSRRKVRVSVIPHSSEDTKNSKFFFVLIPILFLLLFSLVVYLLLMSALNFKNISKYAAVKKTNEEVKLLSIKDDELKEKMGEIDYGVKNLKSRMTEIIPVYKYLSGIVKTDNEDLRLTSNLDSLLIMTEYLSSVMDTSVKRLSENKKFSTVPSLVPVNGWVLRGYGRVSDPYTQTIKMSTGILFVSETEEKVFATADGEVSFVGQKDKLGSTIFINHAGYQTQYSHLSNIIVSIGSKVKKGQHIGFAGKTGKTLSSSLFYKIMRDDSVIDPASSFQIPVYNLYDTLMINL